MSFHHMVIINLQCLSYYFSKQSLILAQVATPNSSLKDSMRTGFQFGFKKPDTVLTTRANSSTLTPSRTGTVLTQQAGHLQISSSILTPINT